MASLLYSKPNADVGTQSLSDRNRDGNSLRAGRYMNSTSFNGFGGSHEFDYYPLRQMFFHKYGTFANEWSSVYYKIESLKPLIDKNTLLTAHYTDNMILERAIVDLKNDAYLYIYNRATATETDKYGVCILFLKETKKLKKIIDDLLKVRKGWMAETSFSGIHILIQMNGQFALKNIKIEQPDIDFNLNYNSDFKPVHDVLLTELNTKSKGLVLLHGKPGGGKTTYIRYLTNVIKSKRIIYIPPNLIEALSSPNIIPFFMDCQNAILIVEDAENILAKRHAQSTQAIANILNVSDGMLSDCLNMQIVATFNTDLMNIDDSLLRKGRLIAKYEFKELEEEKVKALCKKLKIPELKGSHFLSDIYNQKGPVITTQRKKLGF
jgi:hypothetical protein